MIKWVVNWVVNTASIILVAWYYQGIEVDGLLTAFWVSLILGFVNAVLRPILILLTLPINVLSLGLFTFVINGFLLWAISRFISGFVIASFTAAIIGSILISLVSLILGMVVHHD